MGEQNEAAMTLPNAQTPRREASGQLEHDDIPNRVVVYGAAAIGASQVAGSLGEYLEQRNIPNLSVETCREVERIEEIFYDKKPFVLPDAGPTGTASRPHIPTLPRGVVVLPKMRSYDGGMKMYVTSPYEHIRELCEKNGVPVVRLEGEIIGEEQLSGAVKKVLTEPKHPKPQES